MKKLKNLHTKRNSDLLSKLISSPIGTIFMSNDVRQMNKNFKLYKTEILKNKHIQHSPKTSKIQHSFVKTNSQIPPKYLNQINEFYDTIMVKVHWVDLHFFNKNLTSLTIKQLDQTRHDEKDMTSGFYNYQKNMIVLVKAIPKQTLFHELLHVASTIYLRKEKQVFSGFSQKIEYPHPFFIGMGLNEGYTSLLTERYSIKNQCYIVERRFTEIVETIIGKEYMESLYFKADLYHLIEQLKRYQSEELIIDFLINLDFVHFYLNRIDTVSELEMIEQILIHMNNFLEKCYIEKLRQLFNKDLFSKYEIKQQANQFFEIFAKHRKIIIQQKEITLTDLTTLRENLEMMLNDCCENQKTLIKN